ncbi:MAG: 5'/3'-nucleotidase SurE [Alphaproteobacteria bacterium]|nr:5'/3'-nucleotidase SurE [Alphaproteobacteria bacterium]
MSAARIVRTALLAVLLAWPAAAFAGPLRILLTNDDGIDAPGIVSLRARLVEAGYDVTVVAPAENRSGGSGAVTVRGTLAVEKRPDGSYAVSGTPSDCVYAGTGLIMKQQPPDLVISGTNFGQNAGPGLNLSGTFGAARAASSLGYPAIAVSQAFDPDDPARTVDYFDDAADTVVRVLKLLTADGAALPSGMLLNINHPLRHRDAVAGWRVTRPSEAAGIRFAYAWSDDGKGVTVRLEQAARQFAEGTDEAALAAGAVSISPLDPGAATDDAAAAWLKRLLPALQPAE